MPRNILSILFDSGLWMQPLTMTAIVKLNELLLLGLEPDMKTTAAALIVSFIPTVLWWQEMSSSPQKAEEKDRRAAMYPAVPEELLFNVPVGIVLGKWHGRYVCKSPEVDGHVFIIGGSGSGKSSAVIIPSLIVRKASNTQVFALDIKGELSFKSAFYDDEQTVIFNPLNRDSWGYDPLYRLTDDSSGQEVLETMRIIAFSLIPMPANVNDPFWKTSARNLLIGLLVYYYRQGRRQFVDITDEILGRPVKESIEAVKEGAGSQSVEYRYLCEFFDMSDETLGGIVTEMNNHLIIFSTDQDIRHAFKSNENKMNPGMLEQGKDIYLSISENKLGAYYDVLQLIINQTLSELETRPEDSDTVIEVIIDELPRIVSEGKITTLLNAVHTLRSRRVCLVLVTQSEEALTSGAYNEGEVADIEANSYKIVLSASSIKTQETVCKWAGKYRARKKTINSGKTGKVSTSYEDKDILRPADLVSLPQTGEAILISPYGYHRIKKAPYFKDKYLKNKAADIVRKNKQYLEERM